MENNTTIVSRVHQCALCQYSTTNVKFYKQHKVVHSTDKPFKCPECPFRAKWKQSVNAHLKNVHQPEFRPFSCPESGCGYAAKDKFKLTRHSKIHSDETPKFSCSHPNCNYFTNHKGDVIKHTRIHTGDKPYICPFESCSFATARQDQLVVHTRTHTKERPYKCPEPNCQYSTAKSGHLKVHQVTHHPKEGKERPSFSCPLCEFTTKRKEYLSNHVKRHTLEKFFKCAEPNCSFEAKTKTEIKQHKLVHSDEKPFVCPVESCEFRCKFKSNLSVHLKSHSEERRFKCELCPFRGKLRATVKNHLENVHAGPNFQPFKCTEPQCDSTFKTKSNLKTHLLLHKPEKRFSCSFPDCGYRAHRKYLIESHEYNIHSEEKREKCLLCDFRCKKKSNLTIHMRTHTKEKPYKCTEPNCEYQGKMSSNLKVHQKKCHPLSCKQNI